MKIKNHSILRRYLLSLLLSVCTAVSFSASVFAYDEENVFPEPVQESIEYPVGGVETIELTPLTEEEEAAVEQEGRRNQEAALATQLPKSYLSGYDSASPFYYTQMSKVEKDLYNSLVKSYENVLNSYADFTSSDSSVCCIDYINLSTPITQDEAKRVIYAVYYSNPQFFFMSNAAFSGSSSTTRVGAYIKKEYADGSTRMTARDKIQKITAEWLKEINTLRTDLEKEAWIAKKLCDTITYEFSDYDQTIAGALIYQKCVCNGYTMAMTYFCHAAGINCVGVVGNSHAWNIVQLDGVWYETDVTWMDQKTYVWGTWFNKSRSTFLQNDSEKNNHRFDSIQTGPLTPPSAVADYPPCANHKWSDYVVINQPVIDGNSFTFGVKRHACSICFETENKYFCPDECHILGDSYYYDGMNHWRICTRKIPGYGTTCGEKAEITPHVFEDRICTVCGYSASKGDVNGDGRINNTDIILLGRSYMAGDGAKYLDIADMNGDGKITNTDIILLGRLYMSL